MRDDRDHGGGPLPGMPGQYGRRPSGRRPDRGREHPLQTCRHPDIFVRYRATRTIARVSVDSISGRSNELSTDRAINGDGSPVASFSLASTPGPGDTITCSINDQVNFTDHPDPVPRYLHLQQPAAHPKADQGAGSGPGRSRVQARDNIHERTRSWPSRLFMNVLAASSPSPP
jgi:hypothetical protein